MRHGPAEDQAPAMRDFDRALTKSGRLVVERVARLLRENGSLPTRVLSSPLVRARETAELVIEHAVPTLSIEIEREIGPGGDLRGLLLTHADQEGAPMFVGHEPDVSSVTAQLTGSLGSGFDRAMIAAIDLERGARARLAWILDPRTMSFTR